MKLRSRLADVARLAGVSTATVSAVVNNTEGGNIRVSAETRQRVWEAVAQLGYVANPAARSLAGGQNRILGIFTYEPIFPFQFHDFFYPFLLGIEQEAEAQGYHLLLFTNVTDRDGRRSIYHDETNLLYMADGSIMLGMETNREELKRAQQEGYPFVFIGRREISGGSISYAGADYISAVAELTRQFYQLGHRRIAFVGSLPRIEPGVDREAGFLLGCRECGLPVEEQTLIRVTASQITPALIQGWLQAGITGALIEMDQQCQAVLAALHSLGLSVPQDFSIAMLGDPHYQWDNSPDWTMFTLPRREMGIEAVRLLVQRLEHPEDSTPHAVVLPCQIVPGQTIAAARRSAQKEVPLSENPILLDTTSTRVSIPNSQPSGEEPQ